MGGERRHEGRDLERTPGSGKRRTIEGLEHSSSAAPTATLLVETDAVQEIELQLDANQGIASGLFLTAFRAFPDQSGYSLMS